MILTFMYCLGYPVVKAFRRAGEGGDGFNSDIRGVSRGGGGEEKERGQEANMRRRVVTGTDVHGAGQYPV